MIGSNEVFKNIVLHDLKKIYFFGRQVSCIVYLGLWKALLFFCYLTICPVFSFLLWALAVISPETFASCCFALFSLSVFVRGRNHVLVSYSILCVQE